MALISWDDFTKIDMRVGTIVKVEDFPEARKPAFILHIDFGKELGVKKSSAQITKLYAKEDLLGKQVIAVVNFPKKQIGKILSQCLVMGIYAGSHEDVVLLQPEKKVENGMKVG